MKIILLLGSIFILNCSHNQKTKMPLGVSSYQKESVGALGVKKSISSEGFLFGVTVDSVDNLPQIVKSLKKFKRKPTVRIVFDEKLPTSVYAEAISEIGKVAYIMGELVDSYYVKNYSVGEYKSHSKKYLAAFADQVDIWEVGNEINGEWLGSTSAVIRKLNSAYEEVKKYNGKTALTLYYNEECWEKPENEMFKWVDKNLSEHIKNSLDYVFISYYEDDCNGLQPNWPNVFNKLHVRFPNSKLGFGEVGSKFPEKKEAYINRYYKMKIENSHFVGGYFWWYFNEDMVPESKPLWKVLDSAIPTE